ncbi:autotransporter outer membrane beta-barrel domain-containing protein [Ochrobactrum sp. MYb15]|uniref:outer membrane protein n=1 Tax=Brucella pituitosa TaxID=571256 RepID=UPI000CFB2022|nr:autotransporter outer membrane beta-barrel domain-containing protein [Ochrobactrum sp. MYb19]PRA63477.1 autotransporter outer membrane beta-barrel domain-containing protein [Ochrobactrum sp. MYb18]PRA73633.1 autotransporter outer membrane beta-barrel domain-containing protein [Brucella thiophenivorans]PRA86681.1 autotransporter outer membrane beta-barrel domain-containing protein [Ochrobactrum sp. MYb14]PRA94689.1 autotransporter outer membrane beta-barrel domain-containing protein [Ochrobac
MNLRSRLIASGIALSSAGVANAADAILSQEPTPAIAAPVFSWSGSYIGGQVGYGWGKSRLGDGEESISLKPDGFLGGLYAGYNFDTGNNVVLGIDGDLTFNNQKDSISESDDFLTATFESKLRWSGAVRARAGVAVDRFLPYIAGGVAFGSVKNSVSLTDGIDSISASQSKTLTGWTIGGGVDYAATDNVILRLEYRYTDYGKKTFSAGDDDFGFDSVHNKFKTNEIRLGVAYKF